MSDASASDLRYVSALANPSKVHLGRLDEGTSREADESLVGREDDERSKYTLDEYIEPRSRASSAVSAPRSASAPASPARSATSVAPSAAASTVAPTDVRSHASGARPAPRIPEMSFERMMHRHAQRAEEPTESFTDPHFAEREILEKQTVLMEMERLKMSGIVLSKTWTLDDRLDDMRFEVRRHMLHVEETNSVTMMRDGMRLACTGIEMLSSKIGLLDIDGWAAEVCGSIEKYDSALARIYRKYWRRNTSTSPEMEILLGVAGSIGMYHFKRKFTNHIYTQSANAVPPYMHSGRHAKAPSEVSGYDDEEAPNA